MLEKPGARGKGDASSWSDPAGHTTRENDQRALSFSVRPLPVLRAQLSCFSVVPAFVGPGPRVA